MNIQLLQGQFNAKDAIDIITQMIQIKIKFHENKITDNSTEEDIKFSETKIKQLQKELLETRSHIGNQGGKIYIHIEIHLADQS